MATCDPCICDVRTCNSRERCRRMPNFAARIRPLRRVPPQRWHQHCRRGRSAELVRGDSASSVRVALSEKITVSSVAQSPGDSSWWIALPFWPILSTPARRASRIARPGSQTDADTKHQQPSRSPLRMDQDTRACMHTPGAIDGDLLCARSTRAAGRARIVAVVAALVGRNARGRVLICSNCSSGRAVAHAHSIYSACMVGRVADLWC